MRFEGICRATVATLAGLATAAVCVHAQGLGPKTGASILPVRLTVRPHAMAIGKRTTAAGLHELPGLPGYLVYVPKQCIGTVRSPLLVLIHGGGRSASVEIAKFAPLADKYGVIVLLPNAENPGRWEIPVEGAQHSIQTETGVSVSTLPPMHDVHLIDSSLKLVLRQDAIDPDRIALLGFSDGGSSTIALGRNNQDIFSRVAALSAWFAFDGGGPQNPRTQFLVSGGLDEQLGSQTVRLARVLRHQGHAVVALLGLRQHVDYVEDEDFIWRWIVQSWMHPNITTHPPVPTDSDPVLTVDILQRMAVFWQRLSAEPENGLQSVRWAHQSQQWMTLDREPVSVIMTDLPALAAAEPLVAADLKASGLTAAQAAVYRRALVRVWFAWKLGFVRGGETEADWLGAALPEPEVDPRSILGRNVAFCLAHETEFAALEGVGLWSTQ